MATAVATVTSDWQVHLVTDDAGPGVWWRVTNTGADVRVGTSKDCYDRWAPLNVPLVYYWVGTGLLETAEVVVQATHPVLSSTLYAGSVQVVVVDQPPIRYEARSVVHRVIGRPDPLVSVAPMEYPQGSLKLYAADYRRRMNLLSLLKAGDPLILRSTCPQAVDDMTMAVTTVEESLMSEDAKTGPRYVTLDYAAVADAPTAWAEPPSWTWADMEAAYTDWAEAESVFGTWAAAEVGP